VGVFARVSRLLFIVATIRATGLRDSSAPWSGGAGHRTRRVLPATTYVASAGVLTSSGRGC